MIFDLDGTLLTSEKKITEESKSAIWKCKEKCIRNNTKIF